jgi:hypothetical protein
MGNDEDGKVAMHVRYGGSASPWVGIRGMCITIMIDVA